MYHWENFSGTFNQNTNILTSQNGFENVVCKMAAILSRPSCIQSQSAVISHEVPFAIVNYVDVVCLTKAHKEPLIAGDIVMMTSSNGTILRVTGPLWGESTGHRWIPLTKTSVVDLWGFLFDLRLNKRFSNNRDAGYPRRHRAKYGITVMVNKTRDHRIELT